MAIRFVEKEPEDGAAKAKAKRPAAAPPGARPDGSSPEQNIEPEDAERGSPEPGDVELQATEGALLPGLVHPKPEPKPRGRKKPLSAARAETVGGPAADGPANPLLPGLQAHAKPPPKPRGRKKAFG